MAIRGTFTYNFPLVLKGKHIRSLVNNLSKQHCEYVTYVGTTINGTEITFSSMDSLLTYENSDTSRLGSLTIQGFRNKKNTVRIFFDGIHGIGTAIKYPKVFICEYEVASEDEKELLDGVIKHFWDQTKAPYWLQGKYGQAMLQATFTILALFLFIYRPPFRLHSRSMGFMGFFLLLALLYGFVLGFLRLGQLGVEKLFPPIVFLWGEEEKRYEKRKNYILNIVINLLSSGIYAVAINEVLSRLSTFLAAWLG